jgi:DNA polymerase-3 subunit delta'
MTDSETGDLYAGVVGQDKAIAALKAAAVRPVHAYLLVGPPGTGKAAAARGFAAALLCPAAEAGGPPDGTCESCRRALAGLHPDVIDVEREGAAISIDTAREVTRLASTSPLEGARKVLVLHDFHLVKEAGPALLKTIEEPPASTVFVILAEYAPPELITIASRSVRIDFDPLTPAEVAAALEARGIEPDRAAELAVASGGRLDRALLLATDSGFEGRREAWRAIPGRLDGTGATAAALADDLVRLLDSSVEPLRARHDAERAALEERNAKAVEVTGRGGGRAGGRAVKALLNSGISELENRQRREIRRQRTDELRAGLATLAGAYRDRLAAESIPPPARPDPGSGPSPRQAPAPASEAAAARRRRATLQALDHIDKLGRDLQYNPGELLQLQALLMRLGTSYG